VCLVEIMEALNISNYQREKFWERLRDTENKYVNVHRSNYVFPDRVKNQARQESESPPTLKIRGFLTSSLVMPIHEELAITNLTVSNAVTACHTLSNRVTARPTLSNGVTACHTLSKPVKRCHSLSHAVKPCHAGFHHNCGVKPRTTRKFATSTVP